MKKTMSVLLGLLVMVGTAMQCFANYDGTRLTFSIAVKKAGICKKGDCDKSSQDYPVIQVKNRSYNRYRCTGTLKANVTAEGATVTERIRIDEFINPNVKAFVLRKFAPDQIVSDLNTSGIDCTVI
ncbi:MAG: hypothetical protein K0Q50_1576 [Vampirovibrio sp.]|nr:hypothetical protein [Vampirovibrio sp.]